MWVNHSYRHMRANANTLVHTRSSNQSCLFQDLNFFFFKGVGWMWGNIPRVLLSACAVIKRAKPVIIIAYTPAGRRARLRIAMQIRPAPCSCALHRHWYRRRTLQAPYQSLWKSRFSLGAAEARFGVYVSDPADMKVKGMCRMWKDSWRLDKGQRIWLRVQEHIWKGYEKRISNNVFLDYVQHVSFQQLV